MLNLDEFGSGGTSALGVRELIASLWGNTQRECLMEYIFRRRPAHEPHHEHLTENKPNGHLLVLTSAKHLQAQLVMSCLVLDSGASKCSLNESKYQ